MIRLDGKPVEIGHFPDGTLLIKEMVKHTEGQHIILWNYENNEELLAVYFLTKHVRAAGVEQLILDMPYIPNARQDRVKAGEDVFTLKYFAEMINSLHFDKVRVLDAHSNVSLALLDRVEQWMPRSFIEEAMRRVEALEGREPVLFYPDEGAGKRYGSMIPGPYCFGMKKRDWTTGEIQGLDVAGETELLQGSVVLIVDDICSFGGTFLHSAGKLRELGAEKIYLYVTHCESNIVKGELLKGDLIERVYTTDSIAKCGLHDKVTVIPGGYGNMTIE